MFLPGWEEGLFPHQRSLDESGQAGLEEERRLAYVGLTRARRQAKVSFAQNRRNRGLWQAALAVALRRRAAGGERGGDRGQEPLRRRRRPGRFNPYGRSRFDEPAAGFQSGYTTPGWQRAKERRRSRRRSGARQGAQVARAADARGRAGRLVERRAGVPPGERVFHEKFGYGTVAEVDGNKLTIDFDKAGRKRVVDSFVARG